MQQVERPPLVLVWRVTEHCDLSCAFCAYSRTLRRPRRAIDPAQVLAFGQVLRDFAQHTQRPVLVSWLGGEPLRWPPLFEISRIFKTQFGLRLSVTTNGTALDSAAVRQQIVELFDELIVSLDGDAALHDMLRGQVGLFAQLEDSLAQLRRLGADANSSLALRVNTILMRDNVQEFETLCQTVAAWGARVITFNILGGRDRPEFYPAHHLLPEQWQTFVAALPGIRARLAPLGVTVLGNANYMQRLAATVHNQTLPITDCAPGAQFIFLDEAGTLAPCSYTTQGYGVPLSAIRSAADLSALPARFAAQQRAALQPPCYDCPSTQVFGKFMG